MHNTELVYKLIKNTDLVLDIGGGWEPFERADKAIDLLPFSERKPGAGLCKPRCKKKNWIVQDICDHTKPWPFKDNEFDFVVAGHVFEDIRDPIFAMSEMIRVGKKGYVEVPSRFWEQMIGLEFKGVAGFAHHRWIIDSVDDKFRLLFKAHHLHSKPEWHIEKKGTWPHINRNHGNYGMFWEGDVKVFEEISLTMETLEKYFSETIELSKNIENLFDKTGLAPKKITSPFVGDGKPHVHLVNELYGKFIEDNMSEEEFWSTYNE